MLALKRFFSQWLMHWPQAAVYDSWCRVRSIDWCAHLAFYVDDNGIPLDENGKLRTRDYPFQKTWAGMEKVLKSGKAKAIGVSNFSIKTSVDHRVYPFHLLSDCTIQARRVAGDR